MRNLLYFLILLVSLTQSKVSQCIKIQADQMYGIYSSIGTTAEIPPNITFANETYFYHGTNDVFSEFGTVFTWGKFDILPMIGINSNMDENSFDYIYPELYLYFNGDKLYAEAWNIYTQSIKTSNNIPFEGRYTIAYSVTNKILMGVEDDILFDFSLNEQITYHSIGAMLKINYKEGDTFMVFMGSNIEDHNKFVSRYTFLFNF